MNFKTIINRFRDILDHRKLTEEESSELVNTLSLANEIIEVNSRSELMRLKGNETNGSDFLGESPIDTVSPKYPLLKYVLLKHAKSSPFKATPGSAGYDLSASEYCSLSPGEMTMMKTGLMVQIPDGYVGLLNARSGLGTKKGLVIRQGQGIIDSDYRGELMVALYNSSNKEQMVNAGDMIAQLVIVPIPDLILTEVKKLDGTTRGEGGFGSTTKMSNNESVDPIEDKSWESWHRTNT